ncbi:MAG: LysM peptidoglycan-binding domain-containing protein [Clostridia bacterium]|nr:LysM peptidoglycan-binding domain-containing protein [Clostridia bacterium]
MFEPNFTKVVSSVRRNLGSTQSVVEIKLPTNDGDVSQVYTVGAKSSVISYECNGREVSFVGMVNFQAVYNIAGVLASDYTAEFKDSFLSDGEVCGELIVSSCVVDVSSSVVSGGIKVVAIVETNIDVIENKEVSVLTGMSGEDGHILTKDICFCSYLGKAYEKFDVSSDFSIKDALSVFMVTPCVSLGEIIARDNFIIVSGKVGFDVCYKSGESVEDINTRYYSVDFSREVAFDGVVTDSIVQSLVGIVSNEIRVTTLVEDGAVNVNINIPLVYTGYVFSENKLEIVDDVYLEKNYMSITCENFETISSNGFVCFKDNISGTASILDSSPFIDEIVGVSTNNLILASSKVVGDRVCVEGVANVTVIYYSKETSDITSVQVEMPFSVEEKSSGKIANVVTICLENLSARSKRGKEIEVSAELGVYADTYAEKGVCAITQVSVGEEKPVEDCSLFVYVVKPGQNVWDIAKDIGVSQELILEQNPDVELPVKAGDKLVVYKPNVIMFE